LNHRNNH